MKLNESARILLDRYLLGIRRSLPEKKGSDIAAEIESALLDRLDERFSGSAEVNEEQLTGLLEEMGSPRKVAASYGSHRMLIGPRLYPSYLMVLRIVVPVVAGALTLALIIGAIAGEAEASWKMVLEYVSSLFNGMFMAAAWVTLIFAIFERVAEDQTASELADFEKFKKDDLPQLADKDTRPSIAGTVFEIAAAVLGLAFFTYILSSGGSFPVYYNPGVKMGQITVFTANFLRFVPVMMAITGVEIVRSAILLVQMQHNVLSKGLNTLTTVAHILLAAFMLGAFPLINLDWLQAVANTAGWDMAAIQAGVDTGIRWLLYLSIFGSAVDLIRQVVRAVRNPAGLSAK